MKKITFAITVVAIAISGAAHAKMTKLSDRLAALNGQKLSVAVSKLGLPADKMQMGDQVVYSWRRGGVYAGGGDQPLQCTIRLSVDASDTITRNDFDGNVGACRIFEKQLG